MDQVVDMKPFIRLVHRSWADTIWEIFDDPRSSWTAWCVSNLLKCLVVVSLVVTTLQISELPVLDSVYNQIAEIFFDTLFFLEFLFLASIGFAQHLPDSYVERSIHKFLLLFLPLCRFLKLLRYFESFRLLVDAFAKSAEALPVLTYLMTFIVLFFATGIYLVEERDTIPSMPHSLWLALVTMTTVGYGDYYPKSLSGYLVCSCLTFVSVLFLALPVGIIGHEFNKSWQKRTEMLLKTRMRNCLAKWGYGASDVEILIDSWHVDPEDPDLKDEPTNAMASNLEYADADGDGHLVLGEFIELVRQMRIGVNIETAAKLFHMLDSNRNGFLERSELLRNIFPDEYVKHTQQISDETLGRSRRRIGMALERLDSLRSSGSSKVSFPSSEVGLECFDADRMDRLGLENDLHGAVVESSETSSPTEVVLQSSTEVVLQLPLEKRLASPPAMPFLPGVIIDSTSEGRGKVELEHSKKRSADSIGLGIEERLDRLSEQMDLCLAEVVALKPVGDLHPRSWSGVMPPLRARPSTTPSRGQLRVADPPSQRSSKRSARFSQKTDGSETTVVEQHVLQSRPTLATNHRGEGLGSDTDLGMVCEQTSSWSPF
eukprot:g13976.t1